MGAGAAKRLSAVRWGVAGNIVVAWVLTLPASAAVGRADLRRRATCRRAARPARSSSSLALLAALAAAFVRRRAPAAAR